MKFLRRIYSLWCLWWFTIIYLLLFPFFYLCIHVAPWRKYSTYLYRIWAGILFPLCGVTMSRSFQSKIPSDQPFVYCPNHFSYLDIPVMAATTPGFFAFVGKKSLEKIPLFGYMFKKLHIPLDRDSRKSAYSTAQRAKEAIDQHRSIVIFPEGKIDYKAQPGLLPFKDGPFRIAIEKQIPIVPVTIPFNWIILPDDGKYFINPGVIEVIFHEPIPTTGLSMEDLPVLRQQTHAVIYNTLRTYFPDKLE